MCDIYSVSELFFYCINCGCCLCVDCVICGYVGYDVNKVFYVVEIYV